MFLVSIAYIWVDPFSNAIGRPCHSASILRIPHHCRTFHTFFVHFVSAPQRGRARGALQPWENDTQQSLNILQHVIDIEYQRYVFWRNDKTSYTVMRMMHSPNWNWTFSKPGTKLKSPKKSLSHHDAERPAHFGKNAAPKDQQHKRFE